MTTASVSDFSQQTRAALFTTSVMRTGNHD
jgi:hypothetical protein